MSTSGTNMMIPPPKSWNSVLNLAPRGALGKIQNDIISISILMRFCEWMNADVCPWSHQKKLCLFEWVSSMCNKSFLLIVSPFRLTQRPRSAPVSWNSRHSLNFTFKTLARIYSQTTTIHRSVFLFWYRVSYVFLLSFGLNLLKREVLSKSPLLSSIRAMETPKSGSSRHTSRLRRTRSTVPKAEASVRFVI